MSLKWIGFVFQKVENIVTKGEMLVTSIFSFFHISFQNTFSPPRDDKSRHVSVILPHFLAWLLGPAFK